MINQKSNMKDLLNPKSIVIIGVSENLNKLNGRVFKFLLDKKYSGKIYLVNPKYKKILNYLCFKSVSDIKKKIDLAVITVPSNLVKGELKKVG